MVHSEYRFDISLKEQKKSTKTLLGVAILQVDNGILDLPNMKQENSTLDCKTVLVLRPNKMTSCGRDLSN